MRDALKKLRVLDLAWVVAGPLIGRTLADHGATVVRVESSKKLDTARLVGPFYEGVAGPERSALYDNCNAGKFGLSLDLSRSAARAVVEDLVGWADVVVESFAPGQMARWGLDYASLKRIRPDIVMVSTSLMGQSGPYHAFAGFGSVGAAMAGFQNLVGWPGEPPMGTYGPYTDYVAPRFGLLTLLAALDHRECTGEGCWIDLAQAEAGAYFLAPEAVDFVVTGNEATANGNRDAGMAPHGVFPCLAEGGSERWIAIAVRDDAEWARLARLVGGEVLISDDRFTTLVDRKANEDELEALLTHWTALHCATDLEHKLQAKRIPAHVVASSHDFITDPQLQKRDHIVRIAQSSGRECVVERGRFVLSDTPGWPRKAAPGIGQDNRVVLSDILGYSQARIAELEAEGALR